MRYWQLALMGLAAALCSGLTTATAFADAPAQKTPALILTNYPGDAPGTMSIDQIAKSTDCQMKGYLRYSVRAHSCVND